MNRRQLIQSAAASLALPALARAADAPAAPATRPAEFGFAAAPVLANPAPDAITIIACPNALATGWVEFGETEALGSTSHGEFRGQHPLSDRLLSFRVTGLKPGQKYFYRVALRPVDFKTAYNVKPGELVKSEIRAFRTLNTTADTATITVWNDTHENTATLTKLSESLAANPTDMLFWNGDVTNDIRSESIIIPQFLSPANQPFAASTPMFLTRGNHDVRGRDARLLPNYIAGPNGEYFYTFRQGPIAAIVLDSGEDKPDAAPVYAGLNDFNAYRSMQRPFLEKAISDPGFASAPFRLLFVHIPLFWEADVPNDWVGTYGKTVKGWLCEDGLAKWHDLLVKAKIHAVISGHTHKTGFFPANDKHPYAQIIGGGPQPAGATTTLLSATPDKLSVTMTKLDGKKILEETFKA